MFDPLLVGLGEYASREMGKKVASWLSLKKYTIDAVLSSNLGRAIQTALLMFSPDVPMYVVPYIREHAPGDSNAPKDQEDQVHALSQAVNGTFQLNYEWVRVFGKEPGTWDKFEFFLLHSFLPKLIRDLKKKPGDDIVIPVVTHSLFMRDALGGECGWAWRSRDSSKPLNNQVLHRPYVYTTESAPAGSHDATPTRSLKFEGPCGEVASGMNALQGRPCMSDIGEECTALIKKYAHSRKSIWKKTVEKDIIDAKRHTKHLANSSNAYSRELEAKVQQLAAAKSRGPVSCTKTWTGCWPEECVRSHGSCVPRLSRLQLERDVQQLRKDLDDSQQQLNASIERQAMLKSMHCRGGGTPNVSWYLQAKER